MGPRSPWAVPGLVQAVPAKLVARVRAFLSPTGLSPCLGVLDQSRDARSFRPPSAKKPRGLSKEIAKGNFLMGK